MSNQPNTIIIYGKVIFKSSRNGVPDLLIKAWDKDLIFNDLVGSATTNDQGSFVMEFGMRYFTELFIDRKPDLFFEVYYRGKCIHSTKHNILWNIDAGEKDVLIELDDDILSDDEPSGSSYPNPDQFPDVEPDNPVNDGEHVDPPGPGKWKDDMMDWWRERKKQREEDGTLHIPELPLPRPYLDCTSNFGPQLHALGKNVPGEMEYTIWNDGNFAAWTCYVELYEGPWGYSHPLKDYEFRGREIVTVQPGERKKVKVPWIRKKDSARVVGVCYDPILDPKDFTLVEQNNRHITSVHYSS